VLAVVCSPRVAANSSSVARLRLTPALTRACCNDAHLLLQLWHILSALREFVELNYTGFYKITKKHDKMTGIHLLDIVSRWRGIFSRLQAGTLAGHVTAIVAAL